MKYIIDSKNRPYYLQIYSFLRDDILKGTYPYKSKLPSKRLIAEETGVSTVTAEHAFELLCDEGYAEAKQRSGYFVIFKKTDGFALSNPPEKNEAPTAFSPSFGEFSASVLAKTMRRVLTEYGDGILEKSPGSGREELKSAIKRYLALNRGMDVEPERIIIGSGAEYLYRLIIELMGRDKTYAIEHPSYDKLERIYRAAEVKFELLPLSKDGIDSSALARSSADILHTTPYRSFPTGVTASASKRYEYIRWADFGNRFIIESDYGSEFSVSSKPAETLFSMSDGDNVIYLNTFSKTISKSLRVGYMVLPKRLVDPFYDKLGFYSSTVPTFEQLVLAGLISSGDFERHINRVRRLIRRGLAPGSGV